MLNLTKPASRCKKLDSSAQSGSAPKTISRSGPTDASAADQISAAGGTVQTISVSLAPQLQTTHRAFKT